MSSRLSRLWRSLTKGGPKEVARDVSSYVAWRMSGSPPDDTIGPTLEERVADLETALGVLIASRLDRPTPTTSPLVSVILPTRDRPDRLARAVASVVAQSYPTWELLVVDDSEGADPVPAYADDRIKVHRTNGKGVGPARNHGLEEATGDLIAFLDDDNTMDLDWLKTVVLTFEQTPTATVLVGAQVVLPEPGSPDPPRVRHRPRFDWETLTRYNYVDLGMLAHRRLPGQRFDDALPAFLDWDYVVRLTAEHHPMMVPVISGVYHTDAPRRVSYQDRRRLRDQLHERFATLEHSHRSAPGELTPDDRVAVDFFLAALTRRTGGSCRALVVGDPETLRPSLDRHRISWQAFQPGEEPVPNPDLLIIESPAAVPQTIPRDTLVLGMAAHTGSYPDRFDALTTQRRIGDQLWIGSPDQVDFEEWFPGLALTKLGFEPEGPNETRADG